jgi:transposase
MISFSSTQRYYLYRQAVDMRKSFDALSALVSVQPEMKLFSGDVFIFINRYRNRMKLLVWDRSGFVIYYKRLEEGTFEIPVVESDAKSMEIRWEQLVLILEGISLSSVKHRKRYAKSA